MSLVALDYYFPFFVFSYGFIMTMLLNAEWSQKLLQERLPAALAQQFLAHRWLGLVCLGVGTVWSLQNLWLGHPPLGH